MHCSGHKATTLGATDSELWEASRCAATVEAHVEFVGELGHAMSEPAELECDCAAVVSISASQASFKRSLYLARRVRYLQDLARRGKLKLVKVGTDDNVSDILTKILTKKQFVKHRHCLLGLARRPLLSAITRERKVRVRAVRFHPVEH